ncbi:MAG TPA: hypothetical protein VK784_14785 [Pseudonocardiaceae bacterium]|nr:hypothetical protein [Pseudonocardiaceae bacterium]
MTGQLEGSGRLSRGEVALVAGDKARAAVAEMVAGFAGRTITEPRSRAAAAPGGERM